MKKIGLLGSALGALLMQGLAHGAGWSTGPSKRPGARNWLKGTGRTTDKRHWHNPSDPRQAARIEAAAVKRHRRASGYSLHMGRSADFNKAHAGPIAHILNPFYIAK
jgi:hypothetical protein